MTNVITKRFVSKAPALSRGFVAKAFIDEDSEGSSTTTTLTGVSEDKDPVMTLDSLTFTVSVQNTGAFTANTVNVRVTPDVSFSLVGSAGAGWTRTDGAGYSDFAIASIAAGDTKSFTVTYTTGSATNTASSVFDTTLANGSPHTTTEQTSVKLVTKDATAGIRFPNDATEWSDFRTINSLAAASPTLLWRCQEASGNLAETITGTVALAPAGTGLGYQAAITGYTRVGFSTTDNGTGDFSSTNAALPDPSTTSKLVFALISIGAVSALRSTMKLASTNRVATEVSATAKLQCISGANSAAGTNNPTNGVRPIVTRHNVTGLVDASYSHNDKVVPTYSGLSTGKLTELGGNATRASIAGVYGYACEWDGAGAEMSDAALKAMEQAMGFTITWT